MSIQSCKDCPGCVLQADTASTFRRGIEADVCITLGHILSRPGNTESADERIKIEFAKNCSSFGKARPTSVPSFLSAQVSIGDVATLVRLSTEDRPADQVPPTCTGCAHFIPASVVKKELGWNLGMCALKGRLLFPERYLHEAAGCTEGRRGENRDTADGLPLLPMYESAGSSFIVTSPGAVKMSAETIARHAVDPREYVTDRPVSDHERNVDCIRAWRRVDDPEGLKPPVFLPIFDGERLTGRDPRESYGNHKPQLYVDHQGLLYDLAVELMELDETPILIGDAGVGKTEAAAYLAYLMDLPVTRLSLRKDTEKEEFIGKTDLVVDPATGQSVTKFTAGRFTEAYQKPGVIVLDEPNLANDEVWQYLRPAFDSAKQLDVDNTILRRHPWAFVFGAMNPSWNMLYVGTNPISVADLDRVSPVWVDLPPENVERQIIAKHCEADGYDLPIEILDRIMKVAGDLRGMISEGTLPMAWGIRSQIKVARKTRFYSFEKAYRRALTDGLEPEVVDLIITSVRSVA